MIRGNRGINIAKEMGGEESIFELGGIYKMPSGRAHFQLCFRERVFEGGFGVGG